MAVAAASPSAGWVTGVVGVHPWEIAMMDPRVQEEIWGEDPDTWTASPYAPFGRAKKVDGGFLFTGQWPYSTGTDHSDWVILGGMVVGDDGQPTMPPDVRHFVIPRADYEIVEDSWNVLGLKGTGSKDVRMTDVFIPDYRVVEAMTMSNGGYEHRQPGKTLYKLKFPVVFSAAVNSGTLGIAIGALDTYRSYMEQRVSADGRVARRDPIQLNVYAEAAADVAASRTVLLNDMTRAVRPRGQGWRGVVVPAAHGAPQRCSCSAPRRRRRRPPLQAERCPGHPRALPQRAVLARHAVGAEPHLQRLRGRVRRVGHQRPRRRAHGSARLRLTTSLPTNQSHDMETTR